MMEVLEVYRRLSLARGRSSCRLWFSFCEFEFEVRVPQPLTSLQTLLSTLIKMVITFIRVFPTYQETDILP